MLIRINGFLLKVILPLLLLVPLAGGCRDSRGGSSPESRMDNSFSSAEAVTERFLSALRAGDVEIMEKIAADREEFESLLWPHLPASKPGTNLTPEFVWKQSQIQSLAGLRETINRFQETDIELVRVELSGEIRDYGELRLFMEPEVVVSVEGRERKVQLFGALMMLDGEYKIYSYSL